MIVKIVSTLFINWFDVDVMVSHQIKLRRFSWGTCIICFLASSMLWFLQNIEPGGVKSQTCKICQATLLYVCEHLFYKVKSFVYLYICESILD